MESSQTPNTAGAHYVFYRDPGMWISLVVSLFLFVSTLMMWGGILEQPSLVALSFGFGWVGYTLIQRGKKGSFLIGFLIGLAAAVAMSFLLPSVGYQSPREKKEQAELDAFLEQTAQDILSGR